MADVKLGCFAASVRVILIIINVVFLILGILLFALAAILKWSSLFNKFINIKEIDTLVKVGTIGSVTTVLMIIGGAAIMISIFGLLGAKCMSRCLLIVYEITIVILFLAHLISVLVLVFSSSGIESDFKKGFENAIQEINNSTKFQSNCDLSKAISDIFNCCGAEGPSDFKNQTVAVECCKENFKPVGCSQKVVDSIKDNSLNLIIIPSAVILGIELFGIIMVPFLIGKLRPVGYDY